MTRINTLFDFIYKLKYAKKFILKYNSIFFSFFIFFVYVIRTYKRQIGGGVAGRSRRARRVVKSQRLGAR